MKINFKKGQEASTAAERAVCDYIEWQLDAIPDAALAETTKRELEEGKFTLKAAVGAIQKIAHGHQCSDMQGLDAVRKYLCIDGVVERWQMALFFLRELTAEEKAQLVEAVKTDASAASKALDLDLGLDDLFG